MKKNITLKAILAISAGILLSSSCSKEKSPTTGWSYRDPKNGGFDVSPVDEQETGPNLVLVEGGTMTMGRVEDDLKYEWDSIPRRVTLSSFYIDETEVANVDYQGVLCFG